VFGLVCDLERATGFGDFLERFPRDRRHHRLGQSLPQPGDAAVHTASAVRWLCQELVPGYIQQLWELEEPGKREYDDAVGGNRRLYLLWHLLRERQQRLALLFAPAASGQPSESGGALAGCYLAATGGDSLREQGFVAGVFRKLFARRKHLTWTPKALLEEERCRMWTWLTIAAFGFLCLAGAALVWPT
jgi:hypothetical protein